VAARADLDQSVPPRWGSITSKPLLAKPGECLTQRIASHPKAIDEISFDMIPRDIQAIFGCAWIWERNRSPPANGKGTA